MSADKQYRMSHRYWIRTKVPGFQGKKVTFRPNQFQRLKYNLVYCGVKDPKTGWLRRINRLIELKSRKFGTTTGWCIDSLDEVAFGKRYYQAVTMAHSTEKSGEIFNDIVKFAWNNIPQGLRPKDKYNNKTVLDLAERGSKYIVTNDAKGTTPNRLHGTELGYFDKDETIIEAYNALPEDALFLGESTGNGMGNWFETTFSDAWKAKKKGEQHEFYAIFHPWFQDPNNRVASIEGMILRFEDEARALQEKHGLTDEQVFWWDRKKQSNRGLVYQYYPSTPEEAFIHSGRHVFDLLNLTVLEEKFGRQPLRIVDDIEIYEEPNPEYHYGIGVDTAEGLEHGDNAVIVVVCKETGREVAQLAGNIAAHELVKKLGVLCRMYRNQLAVIERNNHGHLVIDRAKDDDAINLYAREVKDKITDQATTVIGWDTNEKSKAYAIDTLKGDLEDAECLPVSFDTYGELRFYVHGDRGKMAAIKGKKDDRVIALALANLGCREMTIVGSLDPSDYGIY